MEGTHMLKMGAFYLGDIDAGVQIDGAFGFLAVFLIFVGVEDVGAVGELRQVEISALEHLKFTGEKNVKKLQKENIDWFL